MRFRWVLLAALVALVLTGCGGGKKASDVKVSVTAQQNGADVLVSMQVTGCVIGKECHTHLRLDGGPEVMPYETEYIIPNVSKGKHSISVEMSDQQHVYLGVKQVVEIDVK